MIPSTHYREFVTADSSSSSRQDLRRSSDRPRCRGGNDFQRFRRGEQHGQRRLRDAHVVPGQQTAVVVHWCRRDGRGARTQDGGQEEPGVPDVAVPQLGTVKSDRVRAAHPGQRDAHPQVQVLVRVGQPHVSRHARQISVREYLEQNCQVFCLLLPIRML